MGFLTKSPSRERLFESRSTRVNGMLVGGLEHVLFLHFLGRIISTDSYLSEGLNIETINQNITWKTMEN